MPFWMRSTGNWCATPHLLRRELFWRNESGPVTVNACAALVEAGDPDRFLAAMAAPAAQRGPLFVLYALNLEVAKAPFVTKEPMIAEMRLQFWRDVVADAFAGKAVRAHEVAGPLAEVIRTHDLSEELLDQMIAARRFDIYGAEAGLDLSAYLEQTAGHLMVLTGLCCGLKARNSAFDVGAAMGTALWLRAVPDLARHQKVAAEDLDSAALVARAEAALARLRGARRADFGTARPAVRAAWLTAPVLRQAIADPRRVIDGGLGVSEFRRRGGLMWRAALGR